MPINNDDKPLRAEEGRTIASPHARQVAALAFRLGARCPYERVGAFLGTSARSIPRALDAAPARPLDTRAQLDETRALIAASDDRGSEPDERRAALAWLEQGRVQAVVSEDPAPTALRHPSEAGPGVDVPATRRDDTLQQLQRRILHRSEVIAYVLARTPDFPLGAALSELLEDVTTAARELGDTGASRGGLHDESRIATLPSPSDELDADSAKSA